MNRKDIAKVCHEVNKAYCEAIGDFSQVSWEDAPEWQKESALQGVDFHYNNDARPADTHESWKKQKINEGWKYGDVKDPNKKTHPCIVPFDELPVEQRAKDFIFCAIVKALK